MPPRSWGLRIADIIEAIEKSLSYVEGMTFDQFVDDPKTIDAVIRNITLVFSFSPCALKFCTLYCI